MTLPNIPKMSNTFMGNEGDPEAQYKAVRTDLQNTTIHFQRLRTELDQQAADTDQRITGVNTDLNAAFTAGLATLHTQTQADLTAGIAGIFPLSPQRGGTGQDSSILTGIPVVIAGIWSFPSTDIFLTGLFSRDQTSENVTSSHHGLAPQSPGDNTKYLNADTPPAYASVRDSDLALTDITTNDVTIGRHGFVPKSPNDATKFLNGANPPAFAQVKDTDIVYTTGTFTATGTGFTVNPTVTATWIRIGALKILYIPALAGTSNATSFTITGLPAAITPSVANQWVYPAQDNGVPIGCYVFFTAASTTITLTMITASGLWTAAGAKSFAAATIVY